MNKKIIYAVSVFLLLFLSGNCYTQTATIDVQVFEPLPQLDIGALIVQNNFQGTPKIFYVQINPSGRNVFVIGTILWDKNDGRGFQQLFEFTTNNFISRNFYSDELGLSGLSIKSNIVTTNLSKDLIEKGKPTGSFRFRFVLHDANGTFLSQTSKDATFENPAQTLSIITPTANSNQSIGSVIANWNRINGAQKYKIKLNVRTNPGQSLEDALNSGTPLINDKEVDGDVTNIDLRALLEREWLQGQELVLRVTAVTGGIGGGSGLPSPIVNFTVGNSSGDPSDNLKSALIALLTQLQNDNATQFVALLTNVSMNEVKFYDNSGSEITFAQFQSLVNSILSSIVKITLNY